MLELEEHSKIYKNEISLKDVIINLKKLLRYYFTKWPIIVIFGIFGGIIGIIYSTFQKPLFKAELSFVVQEEKPVNSIGNALSLIGIDLSSSNTGGEFSGDNIIFLMKSRSIISKALLTTIVIGKNPITLAEYFAKFNKLRAAWNNNPQLKNIHFFPEDDVSKFSLKKDSLLGVLCSMVTKGNLDVDRADKKLSIITERVVSTDELFSKYFADVLIKIVSDYYIETKTEKQVKNVNILTKQSDSVRSILYGGISRAAESIDFNPNPNLSKQILKVPAQRVQISVQSNSAILSELVKNLEIAKMSLLQETPLIHVIDRPILPLEKIKLGKTKAGMLGGLLAGFLIVTFLTIKKIYKNILKDG